MVNSPVDVFAKLRCTPISHWTARELAAEIMKQGIIETISVRHVGRLLKEAELQPHASRYWLTPPVDEEFDAKVKDISDLQRIPGL